MDPEANPVAALQKSSVSSMVPLDQEGSLKGFYGSAQEFTDFPYNQPYFEGYNYQTDMDTGFSSSGDENLTPTESVQWFEHQEVIEMDHQVTEGCYNPYYQNQHKEILLQLHAFYTKVPRKQN